MGFFKKVKKFVKKSVKRDVQFTTAIVTDPKGVHQKTSAVFRTPAGQGVLGVVAAAGGPVGLGVAVAVGAASNIGVQQPEQPTVSRRTEVQPVGLSNILGGVSGILGATSTFGGNFGAISKIGAGFLSGFLPAQGPVSGREIATVGQPQAIQVMGGGPMIQGAATAIKEFVAPALARVSATLGKNISLRAAMIIIRRLGKFLQSPAAIAAAIGLSVAELSTIMVANSMIGSGGKRMNVGNIKALRRAHRRIRGFHRVCQDNDELKRPRRRAAARPTRTVGVVQVKN